MDKETLSNYGWIVICVLVLAVMIALATPFGNYIKDAVWSTTQGLFDVNQNALEAAGIIVTPQSEPEYVTISGSIVRMKNVSSTVHNLKIQLSSDTITDFSTVNVTRVGKNLWDSNYASNPENWGQCSGNNNYYVMPIKVGAGNKVTVSYNNDSIAEDRMFFTGAHTVGDSIMNMSWLHHPTNSNPGTVNNVQTLTAVEDYIYIYTSKMGFNIFNELVNPILQIEIGATATDFEPCNIQTVIANADGSVTGITSVSPIMTIFTDSDVTITCEYQKKK